MINIETPTSNQLDEVSNWPVWDKEPTEFDWTYAEKEKFYIIEGAAIITTSCGLEVAIKPGDLVTIEQGVSSKWKITATIKKNFKFYP